MPHVTFWGADPRHSVNHAPATHIESLSKNAMRKFTFEVDGFVGRINACMKREPNIQAYRGAILVHLSDVIINKLTLEMPRSSAKTKAQRIEEHHARKNAKTFIERHGK